VVKGAVYFDEGELLLIAGRNESTSALSREAGLSCRKTQNCNRWLPCANASSRLAIVDPRNVTAARIWPFPQFACATGQGLGGPELPPGFRSTK
jgi:hypothetical protein